MENNRSIRRILLEMDKRTSGEYDLTTLFEACNLSDEDKKKAVRYIDAYDTEGLSNMLKNKLPGSDKICADDDCTGLESFSEGTPCTFSDNSFKENKTSSKGIIVTNFDKCKKRNGIEPELEEGYEEDPDNILERSSKDLYDYLYSNGQVVYNIYYEDEDNTIQFDIYDGDWKHEHLATENLVRDFFREKGVIVAISSEVTDDNGSDTYSAHYTVDLISDHITYKESLKKSIKEKNSYGGAFDIEDDQYFTREDINEFAYEVVDYLNDHQSTVEDVELVSVYLENNILEITLQWNDYEEVCSRRIDMRRVQSSRDLHKYMEYFVDNFAEKFNKYAADEGTIFMEGFIDDAKKVAKAVGKEVKNSKTFQTYIQPSVTKAKETSQRIKNSDAFQNVKKAVQDTDTYKKVKNTADAVKDSLPNKNRKAADYTVNIKDRSYPADKLKYTLNGKSITPDQYIQMSGPKAKHVQITIPQGIT